METNNPTCIECGHYTEIQRVCEHCGSRIAAEANNQSTIPRGCAECGGLGLHTPSCSLRVGPFISSPVLDTERVAADPVGRAVPTDLAPEGCTLVAHNTGDGWALAVENQGNEIVAYLTWPDCFGENQTADQLRAKGFIIV